MHQNLASSVLPTVHARDGLKRRHSGGKRGKPVGEETPKVAEVAPKKELHPRRLPDGHNRYSLHYDDKSWFMIDRVNNKKIHLATRDHSENGRRSFVIAIMGEGRKELRDRRSDPDKVLHFWWDKPAATDL